MSPRGHRSFAPGFARNEESILHEAQIDGIYIVRASESAAMLGEMGTHCKNTCRTGEGKNAIRFQQLTELSAFQQQVFDLLELNP